MNTAVNMNVVHESEAQRQHARIKLPAKVHFRNAAKEVCQFELLDLSAGGFAFTLSKQELNAGEHFKGKLLFQIDSLSFALNIEFQVSFIDSSNGRVGCEFQGLSAREISALRYLITSYLSGELVTVGDMINTLQRENFTKARKKGGVSATMNLFERTKAIALSSAVFAAGISAFALVGNGVYNHYFVTKADSAMVSVPSLAVTMPREGVVSSLIPADGMVKKGAPVASFSTTLLDVLKGHLSEESINPDQVERLIGKTVHGTLTSPCDCRVQTQLVADGQFAAKGATVFELVPMNSAAAIEARFSYKKFDDVKVGKTVIWRTSGDVTPHKGVITSVALQTGGLDSDIRVTIQPEIALSSEFVGQPVSVSIGDLPTATWFQQALAVN
ncbi:MAG: alginate biosynthesis protein Alg44 [Hahellaceae bacterium]|nr:alginate biosynthesis protein Alg44 [Hahellaceae bacterium]MCP5168322.1 alginate biosynthesis protein Alg44 [Hahellaceae bacterium]